MINNIQDLFSKYSSKLNSKKNIEEKTLFFIKEKTSLELTGKNLQIDLKNKQVKIINLNSSFRFVLNNKLTPNIIETFKKEIDFTINF